jgi:hypothetical protein
MSSKEEKMVIYQEQLKELQEVVDVVLLEKIVNHLGPANYNADASLVACSDSVELSRVVDSFVEGKLLVVENGEETVQNVCQKMKGIKRKERAVFYYLVVKELKVENKL